MEETARFTDAIKELLDGGREERLADLLAEAHPADVSHAIRELPVEDQVRVFRVLSPQHAGEVLAELDDPVLRELVGSLDEAEVSRALDSMPPEEVARLVQRYNLIQVPVVDVNRRLLGAIGVDDVIDVMREEATEDIQRLGGVGGDENVLDPPQAVFAKRLVWRLINLGTAVLAASVIGLFEKSIQTLATLAVFMPIVASMGGIGTTQTATVVVRGIALGDMTGSVLRRVLSKELWLGLTTGAANGLVIAVIAYAWKGQALLAPILG